MAINNETHINTSVILTREIHQKLKELAKKNKRSMSAQIAFIVEEYLEREGLDDGMEDTES